MSFGTSTAAAALQVGGAITGAMGAYGSAVGQKASLESQAQAADANGVIAEINANINKLSADTTASTAELNATTTAATVKMTADYNSGIATLNGNTAAMLARLNAGAIAQADQVNADLSEQQGEAALLSGQRSEQNVMLKGAQLKGTQQSSMAANGVDLGSDLATRILTSTDVMTQTDVNALQLNATRAAWGYRVQATNYLNEGRTATAQGEVNAISAEAQGGIAATLAQNQGDTQALSALTTASITARTARAAGKAALLVGESQAVGFRANAKSLRLTADAISPQTSALTSLLTNAGTVAAGFYRYNSKAAAD